MIDAPVSGGQWGAINGTLSIMAGGDAAVLERVRPIFEAMGQKITHCGPVGAGQTVSAGQMIGLMGQTGSATTTNLHFEVRVGGALVDPMAWLNANAG